MAIELPPLPFAQDALASRGMSAETLEYHHGKHHKAYVDNLNGLVAGTENEQKSLEQIIKDAPTGEGLFNNAAQVWNHTFYWQSMSPQGGGTPSGDVLAAINKCSGSFEKFKEAFSAAAAGQFLRRVPAR